jgi:hypothetical protein
MALTFGSLRHTASGRKRKPLPKTKSYTPKFEPLQVSNTYRRDTAEYKSAGSGAGMCVAPDRSYTEDATFTVAPAYNKGAYQVISKENIKDIGR